LKDWKFIFEKWVLQQHKLPPYEPEVKKLLKHQKGNLFVDIGAHKGIYSKMLRKNFKRIISFEPFPTSFQPTYTCALSDREGTFPFYLNTGTGAADTLLPEFEYHLNTLPPQRFKGFDPIPVRVYRYDSLIKEKADLVKIDVEGSELAVIRGMKGWLPEKILVELHNIEWEKELLHLLMNYGYYVETVDDHPRFFARSLRR